MKNNIILLLIFAGLFTSCDIQMDDVFDRTAAERINEYVEEAYNVLTAAPNGWVMEYYPEKNQSYGGVNILMRFDTDNGVVMINETATDLTATEKSTYRINRTTGAVLAFDTYNSYISYYADPNITLGGGRRYGFMGDLEFSIKSISATEIVLQGTKTMNTIVMKAIPADVTWEEYLGRINKVKSDVLGEYITRFEAIVDESVQELIIDPTYTLLSFTYEDEEGINREVVLSYMYTETGIKFYEPVEIFGKKMQNFTWDDQNLRFACTDPGITGYLQGKRAEYFRPYEWFLGTWKFHSSSSTGTNTVMTVTVTEDVRDKSFKLTGVNFNTSLGAVNFPITMNWSTEGRVSIISGQLAGSMKNVSYTSGGVTYNFETLPIYIYACTASARISTSGAGIISKTELAENRIDFENNGVYESTTGIGVSYYFSYLNVSGATSYVSVGRIMLPVYMVKE